MQTTIHPNHFTNRVELASRLAQLAIRRASHNPTTGQLRYEADWPTTGLGHLSGEWLQRTIYAGMADGLVSLKRTPSEATVKLARSMVEAYTGGHG